MTWLGDLGRDLRQGVRAFARAPLYTVVVVVTLALGIGATTAIFSVVNAVMLRPLPFAQPDRLVLVREHNAREGRYRSPTAGTLVTMREESRLFDGMAGVSGLVNFTLTGERVQFGNVDIETLPLLGVQPLVGRWHLPEDAVGGAATQTVVISYELWQRRFGGDESIIGQRLPGWTVPFAGTVIGVMPPGFWVFPWNAGVVDGWFGVDRSRLGQMARFNAVGRLRPGVSLEQAEAELTAMHREITRSEPDGADWTIEVTRLRDGFSQGYSETLALLLGAVGFVLLIGCVNVASLQLGRAVVREGEMATRAAVGASRWRLVRQLLAENLVLAAAGGALGLLVALVGIQLFLALAPDFYPPQGAIRLDITVFLFALAVSIGAGLGTGLLPAARASTPDLEATLREGARGMAGSRQYARRALVVAEVSLAIVLLVGAGLTLNSYVRVGRVDTGFDPDGLLTMQISLLGLDGYRALHQPQIELLPRHDSFFTDVLARIEALPDVEVAAVAGALPPRYGRTFPARALGGEQAVEVAYQEVSPDYFAAMDIPIVAGRVFSDRDVGTAPAVAVVNRAAAEQLFGAATALEGSLQVSINQADPSLEDDRMREVVGVVADTLNQPWDDGPEPTVYVPYLQHVSYHTDATASMLSAVKDFVIRTSRPESPDLTRAVQAAVASVDPVVAPADFMSMRARMSNVVTYERLVVRLLGLFAGIGLFLAALGIYGVIAYSVAQRTREFGIRTALGAGQGAILRMVVREGLLVTGLGIAIGLGASVLLARSAQIELPLFQIAPTDPPTLAAVVVTVIAVAVLACYVPGRRASRQDPLAALRAE